MDGSLEGRLALVTGATRGIGHAVAAALAAHGARLLLVARSQDDLARVAGPWQAATVAGDVASAEFVTRLAERVHADYGAADIIVHAAGAFELSPITETSLASFDRALAVNLRAAFLLARAFLPAMIERGHGHFVGIGSIAGRAAFPHNGAYSASKFGLRGLHAVIDAELRGTGVQSTLVEPAATDTPLWDDIDAATHPGLPPRSQMLAPSDVADAVLFAITRPPHAAVRNIIVERN